MRATSRPSDQSMQPHPTDLSQACPSSPSPLQACPSSQFSCLTALSNPQPQVTSSQPFFLRALRRQDGRCMLAVQVMPSKLYIWHTHTHRYAHTPGLHHLRGRLQTVTFPWSFGFCFYQHLRFTLSFHCHQGSTN